MNDLAIYQAAQKECLNYLSKYIPKLSTFITNANVDYFSFLANGKVFCIKVTWWIEFELAGKPEWMLNAKLKEINDENTRLYDFTKVEHNPFPFLKYWLNISRGN